MNHFKNTINAVAGAAVFLFTLEASEYIFSQSKLDLIQSKIFKDDQIINKLIQKQSYQPSYNSDIMCYEKKKIKMIINELPIKQKFKDLVKQSLSLSNEMDILLNNIDKNLYDILNIVLKGKHINDKINMNKLNYNDIIKENVNNTLLKHGIYINTFNSSNVIENIDDNISSIDEAKLFIKSIENEVDDKFRIIPKDKIDTFCRSKFITVVDNNRNNDQKELALKLIKERNILIMHLTEDFSNYFESILEQKDLLLLELQISSNSIISYPYGDVFISLYFSSAILDLFIYNRLPFREWLKSGRYMQILKAYYSLGFRGNWKRTIMQTFIAGFCYFTYIMSQKQFPKSINEILVPIINSLEEMFSEYDSDHTNDNDESIKEIIVSPVVLNNGTIYNPLSLFRVLTASGSNLIDEILFRGILFRSLLLGTNIFNAYLFSTVAYSLYKDPMLDLTCTTNEWDEVQSMSYFLLKGFFYQALFLLSGGILLPSIVSICDCFNEHVKEFYKLERKELASSHELIALYRQIILFSFSHTRDIIREFIQPADNSNNQNYNLNDVNDEHLSAISKQVMKNFNTNVNKQNNILTPIDFADFMESFHHSLLIAKYKTNGIDKINAETYEKDLYELLKLNIFSEEHLKQYTADFPCLESMPFKNINNFKKISVNPIRDLQDYYTAVYVNVGLREEELRQYMCSKIFHAGFTKITPELINIIEKELFKWHNSDKNSFLDLMQLYYEGTLQGFDETMKKFCKIETEKFFYQTAGRPITFEDFNEMEKRAFSFLKHPNISNLIKPNSSILQTLGCSHHNFHRLKFLRSNDADVKKLFHDWEQYFASKLFYNRMKKIVYDSMIESEKSYKSTKKITK